LFDSSRLYISLYFILQRTLKIIFLVVCIYIYISALAVGEFFGTPLHGLRLRPVVLRDRTSGDGPYSFLAKVVHAN
jgi:uncharacterized protein YqfA (UPF0365 family)